MHKRIVSFLVAAGLLVGVALAAKNAALVRVSHHDSNDSLLYLSLTEWIDSGSQHTFTNDYEKPSKLMSVGFLVPDGVSTDFTINHYRHIGKRVATSNEVVTAWNTGQPDYYTTTNYVKAFTIENAVVTNVLYSGTHSASGSDLSVILTEESDLPNNWWILHSDRVEFIWSDAGMAEDYFIANFEK